MSAQTLPNETETANNPVSDAIYHPWRTLLCWIGLVASGALSYDGVTRVHQVMDDPTMPIRESAVNAVAAGTEVAVGGAGLGLAVAGLILQLVDHSIQREQEALAESQDLETAES